MALEAFSLIGRIALKGGREVQQGLEGVNNQAETAGNKMGLATRGAGGLASGLATLAKVGAAAAGAGLLALGGIIGTTGIQFNAMKEQSQVAWTTLLGDSNKAEGMIDNINKFAAATPFATENVDIMAKYMHNAGYEGQAMFDQLLKISDVASAFAIPAHEAEELARQMSQVQQAGVAYTEDLNVLQDRGVPIFKALAEVTGTNVAEVKKMASEGKITADLYSKAFDQISGSVEGASEAQSKTFNGMISSLKDNLGILAGELTAGLFDKMKGWLEEIGKKVGEVTEALKSGGIEAALKVLFPEEVVNSILETFENLKKAFEWIRDNWQIIVAGLAGIAGAFAAFSIINGIVTAIALFNAVMAALRTGTLLATLAQWGFNAALLANPLTWIAIAIGALIAAVVLLWLNWDKVSKWLKESWTKIKTMWNDLWTTIKNKAETIWATIKSTISTAVSTMVQTLKDKFESIKNTATSVWNTIKNAIMNPIESAKNAVSSAIQYIKDKFAGLKLKLPDIKLPKFSLKGEFSLAPPKVPSLSVSWHEKGGFFNQPTLLNGLGENGMEAILPLQNRKFMQPFSLAIAENLARITTRAAAAKIEVPIYLNNREILRAIIPDLDRELARKRQKQSGLLNRGNL